VTAPGLLVDASGLIALARLELLPVAAATLGPLQVTGQALAEALVEGMPGAPAIRAAVDRGQLVSIEVTDDGSVLGLGAGETATIVAARTLGLVAVIDDLDARRVAGRQGVTVVGTVALLVRLVRLGVAGPITTLLDRLDAIGFRVAPSVRAWAVEAAAVKPPGGGETAPPGT
jgi:predicted nucleic acid-binding protein